MLIDSKNLLDWKCRGKPAVPPAFLLYLSFFLNFGPHQRLDKHGYLFLIIKNVHFYF